MERLRHPGRVHVMALCPGATRAQFWSRSSSPVEHTRFAVMSVKAVVDKAMKAIRRQRQRQRVLIPSLLLSAATQGLRVSTRALNLTGARLLTGYKA